MPDKKNIIVPTVDMERTRPFCAKNCAQSPADLAEMGKKRKYKFIITKAANINKLFTADRVAAARPSEIKNW